MALVSYGTYHWHGVFGDRASGLLIARRLDDAVDEAFADRLEAALAGLAG